MKTVLFDNSKIHLEIEFERGENMKNPFGNIFLSLFRTFPPLGEAVFDLCLCLKLSQLWPLVHKVYVLWRDGLKTKIHELYKPTSQ